MRIPLFVAAVMLLMYAPLSKPVDVSGAWAVTITAADGTMTGEATLTQSGTKVTGHIGPAGDATIAIAGVLDRKKLTLKTSPAPGRTSAFETCDLTVAADNDRMTGTIHGGDVGKGTIEFVRARVVSTDNRP
jgi:hypothetical protein